MSQRNIHYAWIILIISFLGVLAAQGVRLSFGAFIGPWEKQFSVSRGTISAISFVSYIVFAISQPLIGKMIDRFGIRSVFIISMLVVGGATLCSFYATSVWQLLIIYGIIASLGFGGASGLTASVAVTKWFDAKRGFALGLVEAGFGAGQMILVPASVLLIGYVGWKYTVMILGMFIVAVVTPVLLFFLRNEPSDVGASAYGRRENDAKTAMPDQLATDKSVLKSRAFWFLIIPFFVCGFTTTGLMDTHLIPFTQNCGFAPGVISVAVATLAAFNIIGTLISGIVADRWSNRIFLSLLYFIRALTIALLLVFSSDIRLLAIFLEYPVLLFAFSLSFGLVDFSTVAPTIKLLSTYFHKQSIGLITGWLFMSHQIGSALGSYIPGLLFDWSGSYQLSFSISIALLIAAGMMSVLLPETWKIDERVHGKIKAELHRGM
ncbi:MFS transporter [Paenactinomyces guangxiensis]|uniref:MFS transporter n=1 Tax=Paenactinomyces guangxiensis TaxID=1490290 RepID=A0A7W2A8J9_9BACL|nr:MFS transporter [Paenactinomyces guangxiensis]MBA4493908.1 MFS transporter [Paenactinomyces guangxiensis]MBH8591374.1 MFS transporter [Paenactinomyces guangxiensis]